jgi:hypothetical protein
MNLMKLLVDALVNVDLLVGAKSWFLAEKDAVVAILSMANYCSQASGFLYSPSLHFPCFLLIYYLFIAKDNVEEGYFM